MTEETTNPDPIPTEPVAAEAPATLADAAAAPPDAPATAAAAETAEPPQPNQPPAAPTTADLGPAACGARLAELFPALFSAAPRPIKLRIQADVQERAPGVFTKKAMSVFLHRYTTSNAYLSALSKATQRFDLDGAPAGDVSAEHRDAAQAELSRRRAIHDERRAAERAARRAAAQAEQAVRRAAEAEERRQQNARQAAAPAARQSTEQGAEQGADHDGRRDRAALLRAYETTTLTRANFCALKGIADGALDALLTQARTEREQRPPRPERPPFAQRPPQHAARRPNDAPRERRDGRPPRGPRPQNKQPPR